MKTDAQIREEVERELRGDPRVDAGGISVTVARGIVSLSGVVTSYAQRQCAEEAAHRAAGVLDVANELRVQLPLGMIRADPDLAYAVRHALEWDVAVPDEHILSTVSGGWITLEGVVDTPREREDAERAIHHLVGVRGVTNKIAVRALKVEPEVIRRQIVQALERRADDSANRVAIAVRGTTAIVSGQVRSWAEKEAVLTAAQVTPGVQGVEDKLLIMPEPDGLTI